MTVDVLAFGAHPDDLELSCGGTLAKLIKQGYKVGLVDITQGELSTRGTKEIRSREALEAAKILGATTRRNTAIPDGNVAVNQENMRTIITLIRELKPRTLIIPYGIDRHPDHTHAHQLCKEAWFYAGLEKITTKHEGQEQQPHRPNHFFEFMQWYELEPTFIVDISNVFDIKMKAIQCYTSQLYNPKSTERETKLSDPEFLEHIENQSRYYGMRIGVKHGEPFFARHTIGVNSIFDVLMNKG